MQTSETHRTYGEIFGVFAWLWIFHRARNDLPVVLGWRHPWEHEHDDDHHHAPASSHLAAVGSKEAAPAQAHWDAFTQKAMIQKEVDDDDDEDEEEDDE